MNDTTPEIPLPTVPVRNEPIQARASARVESLLDATAEVIESGSYEVLTTAMVATAARTSIGTVYRYFPDRIALLVGLAARNAERLNQRLERALTDPAHTTAVEALDAAFEAHVIAYREIPSFRVLRTGEMLDLGARTEWTASQHVLEFMFAVLQQRFGFPDTEEARAALDRAVVVTDSLTLTAFVRAHDGDPDILAMAYRLAKQQITDFVAGTD